MRAPAAILRVVGLVGLVLIVAAAGPAHAAPEAAPAAATGSADVLSASQDGIGRQFHRPSAKYVNATCFMPLGPGNDFTYIDKLNRCGTIVTFSSPMQRFRVPQSWADWGERPYVEHPRPNLLSGQYTMTLTFNHPVDIFGVEVDPMASGTYDITATYLRGDEVIGSITRAVSGENGARLLAARAHGTTAVTYTSDDNYGIARLRLPRSAARLPAAVQPNGGSAPF